MQIVGCLQADAEATAVREAAAAGMDAMTEIVTVTVLFAAPDGTGEAVGMAEPTTLDEATNWLFVAAVAGADEASAEELVAATNAEEGTTVADTPATAEVPSTELLKAELATPSELEPLMPPVAPVAVIRASASAWESQVIDVPALLTRGRAAQTCQL
jgi:hypothetical protein